MQFLWSISFSDGLHHHKVMTFVFLSGWCLFLFLLSFCGTNWREWVIDCCLYYLLFTNNDDSNSKAIVMFFTAAAAQLSNWHPHQLAVGSKNTQQLNRMGVHAATARTALLQKGEPLNFAHHLPWIYHNCYVPNLRSIYFVFFSVWLQVESTHFRCK